MPNSPTQRPPENTTAETELRLSGETAKLPEAVQQALSRGFDNLKIDEMYSPKLVLEDMLKAGSEEDAAKIEASFLDELPKLAEQYLITNIRLSEAHDFKGEDNTPEDLLKNSTFQNMLQKMRRYVFTVTNDAPAGVQAEYMQLAVGRMQLAVKAFHQSYGEMDSNAVDNAIKEMLNTTSGLGTFEKWMQNNRPKEFGDMVTRREAADTSKQAAKKAKESVHIKRGKLQDDIDKAFSKYSDVMSALTEGLRKAADTDEANANNPAQAEKALIAFASRIALLTPLAAIEQPSEAQKNLLLELAQAPTFDEEEAKKKIAEVMPKAADVAAETAEPAGEIIPEDEGEKGMLTSIQETLNSLEPSTWGDKLKELFSTKIAPLLVKLVSIPFFGKYLRDSITDEDIYYYAKGKQREGARQRIHVRSVMKRHFEVDRKFADQIMHAKIGDIMNPSADQQKVIDTYSPERKTALEKIKDRLKKDPNIKDKKITLSTYIQQNWKLAPEKPKEKTKKKEDKPAGTEDAETPAKAK